jgi:outer membrane autotransporter protein
VITGAFPILQTGTYKVIMKPLVGGGSVSLTMMFGNANRQTLTTISSGYYIETDLRENLHDYYKYEIHLNAGDELNVEAPSSGDSELVLVNSESVKIQDDTGLGIVYVSSTSEDYYLFVNDSRAFGTNYDGSVTVTKAAANAAELPPPTRSRGLKPAKPR